MFVHSPPPTLFCLEFFFPDFFFPVSERNLSGLAGCSGNCTFSIAGGTCISNLKRFKRCPGCGRNTVAASFRTKARGGGGGGDDGGGSDNDGGPSRREAEFDDGVGTIFDSECVAELVELVGRSRLTEIRFGNQASLQKIDDEILSTLIALARQKPQFFAAVDRLMLNPYPHSDMSAATCGRNFGTFLTCLPSLKVFHWALADWHDGFTDDFCVNLSKLTALEELHLEQLNLTNVAAAKVCKALEGLPNLKRLFLVEVGTKARCWTTKPSSSSYNNSSDDEPDEPDPWTRAVDDRADLSDKGMVPMLQALARKQNKLSALVLHVSALEMSGGTAAALAALLPSLTTLDLQLCKDPPNLQQQWTPFLANLPAASNLKTLDFCFYDNSMDFRSFLGAVRHCTRLESIAAKYMRLSIDNVAELYVCALSLPKLHTFEDGDCIGGGSNADWWRLTRLARKFATKPGWKQLKCSGEIWFRLEEDDIRNACGMEAPSREPNDCDDDPNPNAVEPFEAMYSTSPAPMTTARPMPTVKAPTRMSPTPTPGRMAPPPGRANPMAAPARANPMAPSRPAMQVPARLASPGRSMPTPSAPARSAAAPAPQEKQLSGRAAIAANRAAAAAPPKPMQVPSVVGEMSGNWKLGEKKKVKEKAESAEASQKALKAKLGAAWTVTIDWQAFDTVTADSSDRDPGDGVIERILACFIANDVNEMDSDVVDALNGLAGKQITFTCQKTLSSGHRVEIKKAPTGVVIVWNGEYYGYDHKDPYLRDWVLNNC